MKLGLQLVSIKALIRRNWLETEMRDRINEAKVQQYADEMREGAEFPAPVVFFGPDELYRVGDGFHRISAWKLIGDREGIVDLRKGGYREAMLHNIEVNRKQLGLPLTTGDKMKCILALARDVECRKWTQARIAETVGCAQSYVGKVIAEAGIARPEHVVNKNGKVMASPKGRPPDEDIHQRRKFATDLFLTGKSRQEISSLMNLNKATVATYVREGLEQRRLVQCSHCNGTGYVKGVAK